MLSKNREQMASNFIPSNNHNEPRWKAAIWNQIERSCWTNRSIIIISKRNKELYLCYWNYTRINYRFARKWETQNKRILNKSLQLHLTGNIFIVCGSACQRRCYYHFKSHKGRISPPLKYIQFVKNHCIMFC